MVSELPEVAGAAEAERAGLRKLWLVLALLGLVMSVNVLGATQGTGGLTLGLKAVFSLDFADAIPEAVAAFWGVVVLTLFVTLASAVVLVHARRTPGSWVERFPMRVFEVPPSSPTGRVAQALAIVLFALLPVYVLAHSWRVMLDHGVRCAEPGKNQGWVQLAQEPWAFFVAPPPTEQIRLGSSETVQDEGNDVPPCSKGRMTDYWFPVQTYVLVLLGAGAVALWLASLVALFQRGSNLPDPEPVADLGVEDMRGG